jgi:type I restriction enzyme S subunit
MPEEIDCVKGWSWKKLSELARLESGHTPRKTIPEYWEGGDVPWICLQDIRAANGKVISETVLKPTMHGIDNSSARMLPKGTVVFSRDISVGYVTIMGREMATSQHFANWICGPELNNQFLMYALMASRQHLISSQQGSTVGTIYMPALKEFHLLTPPLAEQQEIVRRVEGLFALADQIEARFEKAQAQVAKLTPSLLARAFAGQLVPQDPTDEPAEKLLERLRPAHQPKRPSPAN